MAIIYISVSFTLTKFPFTSKHTLMNFKVVTLFVCFNFLFLGTLNAQVVSISPAFATENDNNVVITFDASQGNAGLLGENVI